MPRSSTRTQHRLGPRRDPAVDEAVLAATRALLVELGYTGTTVDGIARRAGVSRPAIYRRWPSKALLVHEAVFPADVADRPEPATFAEEIARHVSGTVEAFASAPARAALPGLIMEMRNDPELRQLLSSRLEQEARRHFVDDVVAPAVEAGHVRTDLDADTVFDAITGAVVIATCVRDIADLDAFAAALADVVVRGCLATAGGRPGGFERHTG
jgi:AcrR family transcriptional regulator